MELKKKIENAINELKQGHLIVVSDDYDRENEGDLIGLQQYISPKEINFMITHGKGLLCVAISPKIAFKHSLYLANQINSDGTNFTISIDGIKSTTGISAFERFDTMNDLLNEQPISFKTPGHTFPLIAKSGGLSIRRGHTEAVVDLAKLANAKEVGALVEIIGNDGKMIRGKKLTDFSNDHNLVHISIEEIVEYIHKYKKEIFVQNKNNDRYQLSKKSYLPTKYGNFNIIVIKDKLFNEDNILLFQGKYNELDNTYSRVHSACLTSESFLSKRCDCKDQLNFAFKNIAKNKKGFILYVQDEGRGIGIFDKINAYNLQDHGLDTLEANLKLNRHGDERDFDKVAEIYKFIGITKTTLITNNPNKINALKKQGITIKRLGYWSKNKHNEEYIKTKTSKMNHIKDLNE